MGIISLSITCGQEKCIISETQLFYGITIMIIIVVYQGWSAEYQCSVFASLPLTVCENCCSWGLHASASPTSEQFFAQCVVLAANINQRTKDC